MDVINNNSLIISLLFLFLLCCQQSHATNITEILSNYPDFSNFNNYLTQAQLVNDINTRQSITILAVDNGGTGSISGEGLDVIRTIMSIHVLLDYYDAAKFRTMAAASTLTPSLFQTTGRAVNQQGFVNLTITTGGAVFFGSGVVGSSSRASLVKTVAAQPYNVSVLQVSGFIYPKGIQNSATSTPPPPTPPPPSTTASPPSPTTVKPPTKSKSPSPVKAPSPVALSPKTTPSKSPKTAPPTDLASASAPSPVAEGPADSPVAADKAGAVRFGGDGIILMLVAISTWLTMG